MSTSKLDIVCRHTPREDPGHTFVWLLHDYLQLGSEVSVATAVTEILDKVAVDPRPGAAWSLAGEIMLFSRLFPPESSSFQRELDLVVGLYSSDRWPQTRSDAMEVLSQQFPESLNGLLLAPIRGRIRVILTGATDIGDDLIEHTNMWKETLRSDDRSPDQEYRSFIAFHCHCTAVLGIQRGMPDPWALWTFRDCLEGGLEHESPRDGFLYAAAEFILIDGYQIYQFVLEDHTDLCDYIGPSFKDHSEKLLANGIPAREMALERWRFWKKSFEDYSLGRRDSDLYKFSDDAKGCARQALAKMEQVELLPVSQNIVV